MACNPATEAVVRKTKCRNLLPIRIPPFSNCFDTIIIDEMKGVYK